MIYILVIILLLVIIIGILELTSSYSITESINKNAPVQTFKEISIKASTEKIYKIMTDVNHWADWQPEILQPSMSGNFEKGNSFNWKNSGLNIKSTIHTAIPYRKIGWTGPAFGCFAIHNWTFKKMDGYTEVIIEESMEGWLVKIMPAKFQKGLEQTLDFWMKNLKTEAEK